MENSENLNYYNKKVQKRRLSSVIEYTTSKLGWQISLVVTLLSGFSILNNLISGKTIGILSVGIFSIYFLAFIIQFFVTSRIKKDVINNSSNLTKKTRKLGIILVPFVLSGNFLLFISGLLLVKEKKDIVYNLGIYSLLISLFMILISLINLFKPTVVSTYYIGLAILITYAILNSVILVVVALKYSENTFSKLFLVFSIFGMLGIFIGNVFSFLMGLILFVRYLKRKENSTVLWIDIIKRLFRNYTAVLGLFIVVFLIAISVVSFLTFDYNVATLNDYNNLLQSPSLMYPFGTDELGRCVFTRIIFGSRISLTVGIVSVLIPIVIGGALGAISGYFGGLRDNFIMRTLDVLYAVPGILLAIAIIAAFGVSTLNLIIALSIGGIPTYARTVRASVLSLTSLEFVEAARACGAKDSNIIIKHIIPNSLAPVIVRATMGIGGAVLATSSLSFLGLGVESYVPEWGNILRSGSVYLETNSYIAIFPGLAIIMIVLAFNYFGDGLRDALDPKLK